MADERLRTKRELKNLFTNLKRKGISDDMISILIEALWRDKANQRSAGFYHAGGWDTEISFDVSTRIFSIIPFNPLVENFEPRYSVFSWSNEASLHRIFTPHQITIPNEEGLFCVYFDKEPDPGRNQILFYKKNPTPQELEQLYVSKILISFFYWDATNNEVLHFGDDRHGSERNPAMQWNSHTTLGAQRKTGLQIAGYIINGDGSQNTHAQFVISAGTIIHDDIELDIPETTVTIPVLFFFNQKPRFASNSGYSVLTGNRLLYNPGLTGFAEADNGNFVLYHYFATNEISNASRKIISVMGTVQYTSIQSAFTGTQAELDSIKNLMPMQGRCYIDSAIFQTSDNYTNAVKSRIVGFVKSLWPDTREYVTEMLLGNIDGANTIFTTSKPYTAGKISVLLNGLKEYQFSEINETTVQMDTPPKNSGFTDIIECIYKPK
jgi:hypothetical protein